MAAGPKLCTRGWVGWAVETFEGVTFITRTAYLASGSRDLSLTSSITSRVLERSGTREHTEASSQKINRKRDERHPLILSRWITHTARTCRRYQLSHTLPEPAGDTSYHTHCQNPQEIPAITHTARTCRKDQWLYTHPQERPAITHTARTCRRDQWLYTHP